MYKIAPTNSVYFGPYLRYTNMDLERGLWLGSIMLVTDQSQPPSIHIHQSADLSPNPRQLKAHPIHSHQRWIFYRYDIDLRMEDNQSKWTYAITSHLGCTRYEFLVAARSEQSWRFIAHSGNDFAINVSANDRAKLGGIGPMWKDVLLKHQECGGFHTQLGLGGQIYADRLWKDIPALRQWTQMSGKENRKNAQWTAKMDEDVVAFRKQVTPFEGGHVILHEVAQSLNETEGEKWLVRATVEEPELRQQVLVSVRSRSRGGLIVGLEPFGDPVVTPTTRGASLLGWAATSASFGRVSPKAPPFSIRPRSRGCSWSAITRNAMPSAAKAPLTTNPDPPPMTPRSKAR